MWTVHEICAQTGLSKRTLQYYDRIGLLPPAGHTEAGYRLYDEKSLETLQQIMLFRELEFPLKEIKRIIKSSNFDRNRALEQQIELLTMKKEHLENLILFAKGIRGLGVNYVIGGNKMDWSAFDTHKIDEYAEQAKKAWGKTPEYQEFTEKQKGRSEQDEQKITDEFMELFVELGKLKQLPPDSEAVQEKVAQLRDFISRHFYQCSYKVFAALGHMYAGGGSMTENIDAHAGEGTAQFTAEAVRVYCEGKY